MIPRRLDLLPLGASLIAFAEAALYVVLVITEDGRPAWWAIAILVVGGAGAAYATPRKARWRSVVLSVCAALLGALGYLALLSIGLPLLLASGLCIAAVLRTEKDWRDTV